MKKLILICVLVFSFFGCDSKVYKDTEKQILAMSDNVVKKVSETSEEITEYSNTQIIKLTKSLKLAMYESIKPVLPWIFLISFFLLFGILKMVVPFSHYGIIQLPLFVLSYGFIISMFYSLGIVVSALKATLWVILPLVVLSLVIYISKDALMLKIENWNEKFNLKKLKF